MDVGSDDDVIAPSKEELPSGKSEIDLRICALGQVNRTTQREGAATSQSIETVKRHAVVISKIDVDREIRDWWNDVGGSTKPTYVSRHCAADFGLLESPGYIRINRNSSFEDPNEGCQLSYKLEIRLRPANGKCNRSIRRKFPGV